MKHLFRGVAGTVSSHIKKNSFKFLNSVKSNVTHLFLLSPPLSGSTAIKQLLDTSPNLTSFHGNGEGQFLPEVREVLLVDRRWDPDYWVDWKKVKSAYFSYWSPFKPIRFEKSPPNIIRAEQLAEVFENCRFLITIRNPYAVSEGLLRRGWAFNEFGPRTALAPPVTPSAAAEFWMKAAHAQIDNLQRYENQCLFFTYEELAEKTERVIQDILSFLPDLGYLNSDLEFTAHNTTGKAITGFVNLNQRKIDCLSRAELDEINEVLCQDEQVLKHFGYNLL